MKYKCKPALFYNKPYAQLVRKKVGLAHWKWFYYGQRVPPPCLWRVQFQIELALKSTALLFHWPVLSGVIFSQIFSSAHPCPRQNGIFYWVILPGHPTTLHSDPGHLVHQTVLFCGWFLVGSTISFVAKTYLKIHTCTPWEQERRTSG